MSIAAVHVSTSFGFLRTFRSMVQSDPPTLRSVANQWIPMSATWIMMAVEGPFLAAVIARLPNPDVNLAAYGVAFSFAMLLEAPIIMMLSASTAIVKDIVSYKRLRNFLLAMNTVITLCMIVLILPPVFHFVATRLIGLPIRVARLTHTATTVLLPWPAAIGFRRFWNGILISNRLTRRVAYGTLVRLASIAAVATIIAAWTRMEGAVVGALALSVAVTVEAVASRIMTSTSIRRVQAAVLSHDAASSSYGAIARFYFPLAMTSVLALGVQPVIAFFVGRSRMPIVSLAVLPVVNSTVFLFRSFGHSLQEVAIANMGPGFTGYPVLRRFAVLLGAISTFGILCIAFTPLSHLWLKGVAGLEDRLLSAAVPPLMIQSAIPAASVLMAFQHAVLISARRTTAVTTGTFVEACVIVGTLALLTMGFDIVGATAAAFALLAGRLSANLSLWYPHRAAVHRMLHGHAETTLSL
ncbi:MAG: hypothetical protein QHI48_00860 [Bacteroidota bacterium]|nr:hypothetical protein [Bacteroidota bacterium]